MKEYTIEREIDANIEVVYKVLDGHEYYNLSKLDPKIIAQKPILITDNKIGSIYQQTYSEHGKNITYNIYITDVKEEKDYKKFNMKFNIMNWFDITLEYEFIKIDEDKTVLKYKTTNTGIKFVAKLFMLMPGSGQKMLNKYFDRIEKVVADYKIINNIK